MPDLRDVLPQPPWKGPPLPVYVSPGREFERVYQYLISERARLKMLPGYPPVEAAERKEAIRLLDKLIIAAKEYADFRGWIVEED